MTIYPANRNAAPTQLPLPPKGARSQHQRLQAADTAWAEFMAVVRDAAGRPSPVSGARRIAHLALFLSELVRDKSLQARILDDFERQMRDELPRENGQLFS